MNNYFVVYTWCGVHGENKWRNNNKIFKATGFTKAVLEEWNNYFWEAFDKDKNYIFGEIVNIIKMDEEEE